MAATWDAVHVDVPKGPHQPHRHPAVRDVQMTAAARFNDQVTAGWLIRCVFRELDDAEEFAAEIAATTP